MGQSLPHVHVDVCGLPGSPDETAEEEREEQQHPVVPLRTAAGHVDLVEEPVDVEERGRELVEDESRGVEVDEGSLDIDRTVSGSELTGYGSPEEQGKKEDLRNPN